MGKVERGVKMSGSEKVEDEDVRKISLVIFPFFSESFFFSAHKPEDNLFFWLYMNKYLLTWKGICFRNQ